MVKNADTIPSSRMTEKGQVTIPKEVREKFDIRPGDEVEFITNGGILQIRRRRDPQVIEAAIEKFAAAPSLFPTGVPAEDIVDFLRGPRLDEPDHIYEARMDKIRDLWP